jgi:hypothetical protein
MLKQSPSRIKIALVSLLVVFCVAAMAAPAVGAYQTHSDSSNAGNKGLQSFSTEQSAKQHCSTDTVVWLNLNTHIYHFKGEHSYGNTKNGAYVCQKEADKAGNLATREKSTINKTKVQSILNKIKV